jgi:predicted RNase H-like HicB family nuclease
MALRFAVKNWTWIFRLTDCFMDLANGFQPHRWLHGSAATNVDSEVWLEYAIVIEQGKDGSFSAYLPDLPGCVACGNTIDEVRALIAEATTLHVESLQAHGEAVPATTANRIE